MEVRKKINEFKERRKKKKCIEIDELIHITLEERNKYEPGSKEWKALDDDLSEFYKIRNDKKDIKSRIYINIAKLAGCAIAWFFAYKGQKYYFDKATEYESTGAYTSNTGRQAVNNFVRFLFKRS